MKPQQVFLWSGLCLGLALAVPAIGQEGDKAGEKRDTKSGVTLGVAPKGAAKAAVACTLTVSPNPATNGQTLNFSIGYNPCDSQPHKETFTFKWPSNLAGFREVTTRQKIWSASGGCIASSFEITVVPSALAVKGAMRVTVESRNTTTNALICTATAPLTIN
ncbi:MAG TPA: hypothetical protein VN783_00010 [Thermoanaerobaculia bacterium]|nr:hypothetical protein [Thermoanaerobaculia bacterium]